MADGTLAAYVFTSGCQALTRRTLSCLSGLHRVEVGRLSASGPHDPHVSARDALADWPGWSLVLVEGDLVDVDQVLTAVGSGGATGAPMRRSPASIAPDALRLPGRRLIAPGRWDDELESPLSWTGTEQERAGVSWELSQVAAGARTGHPVAADWALAQAVRLTQRQVDGALPEQEALWLAELLLLAGEGDAVVVRAQRALQRALSAGERVRWAELGLAAAVTGQRTQEAAAFVRALSALPAEPPRRALWSHWTGLVAEAQYDFPSATRAWSDVGALAPLFDGVDDPWLAVSRARRGKLAEQAFENSARSLVREQTGNPRALAPLVDAWRAAGLPPAELLASWPDGHSDLLVRAAAAGAGASVEWRLDLLDQLFAAGRAPRAKLVALSAPLAALVGLEESLKWSARTRETGMEADDPLELRARSPLVTIPERILAAVCVWMASPERLPLLLEVVDLVHVEDVPDVLVLLHQTVPDAMPVVLDAICVDEPRRRAVDHLVGSG